MSVEIIKNKESDSIWNGHGDVRIIIDKNKLDFKKNFIVFGGDARTECYDINVNSENINNSCISNLQDYYNLSPAYTDGLDRENRVRSDFYLVCSKLFKSGKELNSAKFTNDPYNDHRYSYYLAYKNLIEALSEYRFDHVFLRKQNSRIINMSVGGNGKQEVFEYLFDGLIKVKKNRLKTGKREYDLFRKTFLGDSYDTFVKNELKTVQDEIERAQKHNDKEELQRQKEKLEKKKKTYKKAKPIIEKKIYEMLNVVTQGFEGKIIPKNLWVDFSFFKEIQIPKQKKGDYDIPKELKSKIKYI